MRHSTTRQIDYKRDTEIWWSSKRGGGGGLYPPKIWLILYYAYHDWMFIHRLQSQFNIIRIFRFWLWFSAIEVAFIETIGGAEGNRVCPYNILYWIRKRDGNVIAKILLVNTAKDIYKSIHVFVCIYLIYVHLRISMMI